LNWHVEVKNLQEIMHELILVVSLAHVHPLLPQLPND